MRHCKPLTLILVILTLFLVPVLAPTIPQPPAPPQQGENPPLVFHASDPAPPSVHQGARGLELPEEGGAKTFRTRGGVDSRGRADGIRIASEGEANPVPGRGSRSETGNHATGNWTGNVSDPSRELCYVIITDERDLELLEPLARWKSQRGQRAEIFLTTDIYANFSGLDKPEKIRNFLKSLLPETKVRYLLLAGDIDTVPVREAYCEDPFQGDGNYVPTDSYYAFLEGDWDDNLDERYGDFGNDKVNWTPQVFVGRLPFSNQKKLQAAVQNILDYEQRPEPGNWTSSAFLAASYTNYDEDEDGDGTVDTNKTDEATLTEAMKERFIPEHFQFTRLYENQGIMPSNFSHEHGLTLSNVTLRLDPGHSIASFSGHGSRTAMFRGIWLQDTDEDGFSDGGSEEQQEEMLNRNVKPDIGMRRPLSFLSACYNGFYDDTETSLAEHSLEHFSIGVVASSQAAWYQPGWTPEENGSNSNQGMEYRFWEQFFTGNGTPGEALYRSKEDYTNDWSNLSIKEVKDLFSYNLFGDPGLQVWTRSPEELDVSFPDTLMPGERDISIRVQSKTGQPVAGASVTLMNQGLYLDGRTGVQGFLNFSLLEETTATLELTVTTANCLPFQGLINGKYPPVVTGIILPGEPCFRDENISLLVSGEDDRDLPGNMLCQLALQESGEETWILLPSPNYNESLGSWVLFFQPGAELRTGSCTIKARLKDSEGSWSSWFISQEGLELVNRAPEAVILNPGTLQILEGDLVILRGKGLDEGETQACEWKSDLDGVLGDTFTLPLDSLSNGSHLISFRVMDDGASWSQDVTISLKVNGIPRARIGRLWSNPVLAEQPFYFRSAAEDDGLITSYRWETETELLHEGPGSTAGFPPGLEAGTYTVSHSVMDDEGVWSEPVNQTLEVHGRPQAFITTPSGERHINRESVQLSGYGLDDGETVSFRWSSSLDGILGAGEKANFTLSNLSLGEHKIFLRAQDGMGVWSDPATITLEIRNPNKAPRLALDSSANSSEVQGVFIVQGTARDEDGGVKTLEYSLDGGSWTRMNITTGLGFFQWSHRLDTKKLENGNHSIAFRASDGEDHSKTEHLEFTVVNSEKTTDVEEDADDDNESATPFLRFLIPGVLALAAVAIILGRMTAGKGRKKD